MGRFNLIIAIIAIIAMFICNTVAFAANRSNAACEGKTSSAEVAAVAESVLNMEVADAAALLPSSESKSVATVTFEAFTAEDALALVADFQGINAGNATLSAPAEMLLVAELGSVPSFDDINDGLDILMAIK